MLDQLRRYRKDFTNYVNTLIQNSDKSKLEVLSDLRGFKLDTLKSRNIFYIEKEAQMLVPDENGVLNIDTYKGYGIISPTNNRPIYSDRYVIPLYDLEGNVMALVGYSLTSKQRYMYSNTQYFMRNNVLYNLQVYEKCLEDGYVVVTEGITDAIRLLDMGFTNVMSTCGAHKSLWMMQMLDMIDNVVFIPDRDRAGRETKNYWITHNYTRLLVPHFVKDLDDFAKMGEKEKLILKYFIHTAIEYMKEKSNSLGEELPIMYDGDDVEWLAEIEEEVAHIK